MSAFKNQSLDLYPDQRIECVSIPSEINPPYVTLLVSTTCSISLTREQARCLHESLGEYLEVAADTALAEAILDPSGEIEAREVQQ